VIAVSKDRTTVRHAYCDDDGNFCLRFVPPGDYVAFAHGAGWQQLRSFNVNNDLQDIGDHTLTEGAVLTIHVTLADGGPLPDRIELVDSRGIVLEVDDYEPRSTEPNYIGDLWPDDWTVRLMHKADMLTESHVRIAGVEAAAVELKTVPRAD
jgi:hypothetical protein